MVYTNDLGCSTATLWVLWAMKDEGKMEDLLSSFFFILILTSHDYSIAVMPIDEATHATEQLLGPYTREQDAKRGLVVRELCLNCAYVDPIVHLVEHPDPD